MNRYSYFVIALLLFGCKEVPKVTTNDITGISTKSAQSGGNIHSEGSGTILSKGVCWSTKSTPCIKDNITNDGAGANNFSSQITNLEDGQTYFVRAYASNKYGTGYGMALTFTTKIDEFKGGNKNLISLYKNIFDHYELPDFQTFLNDLKDTIKSRRLYITLKNDNYDLPDYETFLKDIGMDTTLILK